MDNISIIREAMARKGIATVAALAKATGINAGLLGRYLAGKNAIGMRNAPRIAAALDLDEYEVMRGRRAERVAGAA
jgi:transcriptional regulator with XRE-family HTH domain